MLEQDHHCIDTVDGLDTSRETTGPGGAITLPCKPKDISNNGGGGGSGGGGCCYGLGHNI